MTTRTQQIDVSCIICIQRMYMYIKLGTYARVDEQYFGRVGRNPYNVNQNRDQAGR